LFTIVLIMGAGLLLVVACWIRFGAKAAMVLLPALIVYALLVGAVYLLATWLIRDGATTARR
jgi:hypothetical protein